MIPGRLRFFLLFFFLLNECVLYTKKYFRRIVCRRRFAEAHPAVGTGGKAGLYCILINFIGTVAATVVVQMSISSPKEKKE